MRPCRGASNASASVTEDADEHEAAKRKSNAGHCKRSHKTSDADADVDASHLKVPEEIPTASPMKLTKYERVHILSVRANALAAGAPPMLPMLNVLDPLLIAMEEMKQGLLAPKVVRTLPSGKKEVHAFETLL